MARTKRYIRSPSIAQGDLRTFMNTELAKLQTSLDTMTAFIEGMEDTTVAVEVGSWVPTIAGSTTAGVGTYSNQAGQYYKNGRLVLAIFHVLATAHTGTGQIKIPNLPFKAANNSLAPSGSILLNSAPFIGLINANSLEYVLFTANVSASMDMFGSIIYLADS